MKPNSTAFVLGIFRKQVTAKTTFSLLIGRDVLFNTIIFLFFHGLRINLLTTSLIIGKAQAIRMIVELLFVRFGTIF